MPIRAKLLLILISFVVIPIFVYGVLVFSDVKKSIKQVRVAQLNNIADLKKDKIETFFHERAADLASAQSFYNIKMNLPKLNKRLHEGTDPSRGQDFIDLDRQLKEFQRSYQYLNVILTDIQGRVVYSSNDAEKVHIGKALPEVVYFKAARKGIYFTDIFRNRSFNDRLEIIAAAPLRDFKGTFIGEIVIEIDMEQIYKFISDTTGLGETGEVVIARKEADTVVFSSPLRHDSDAVLKRKVSLYAREGIPAQKAVQGENGSGIALDYGGVEVLAAWRYIPSLRWGLVTKIEAREAFTPITRARNVVVIAGIAIILLAIFAALSIARTITSPILRLQKDAEAIAAGDLSHRVDTAKKDEVGRLSRAFDAMTEALVRDLEERKRAAEEIKSLNDELKHKITELEAVNEELESFSSSVSHDLRSPLRSIEGFSLAILEDCADRLDDTGKSYLTRVRNATMRMGQLIDDLLKLSRVTRSEMNRERVDLSAMTSAIADNLRKQHPERTAECIIAGGLTANGDGRLLTIALENLLANAWKFSEKKPRSAIEFGAIHREGARVFYVKDNGVGFNMAYAGKLFDPFQRMHKVEEFPGTGIGLATVKRIINRHGGRVWVESEVNKGTTVYFTL